MRSSELARLLKPYITKWINEAVGSGGATSQPSASTAYAPSPHPFASYHHSNQLPHSSTYLSSLTADTHTQYAHADGSGTRSAYQAERLNKTVTAGSGLTGGGTLTGDISLEVGAGDGLAVTANAIQVAASVLVGTGITHDGANNFSLPTPGTLHQTSTNAAASPHTHAITSSSNAGASASLLATSASGYLAVQRLGAGSSCPLFPLHASSASEQLRLEYNSSNYATFQVDSTGGLIVGPTGNLAACPGGDFIFDPTGNDILPNLGYDLNIGAATKKYLTLHAAELWVDTLVAASTLATIGGRLLIGPTTILTRDLSASANQLLSNADFKTLGAGGTDVFASWTEVINSTGSVYSDASDYRTGAYAARLTTAASAPSARVAQQLSASQGVRYQFTFWTHGDGTNGGRYGVQNIDTGGTIIAATNTQITGSAYAYYSASFVVPPSCSTIEARLLCSSAVGASVWFDDVVLTACALFVKHNEMSASDTAYLEDNGRVEFIKINSAGSQVSASEYLYNVLRDLDGSGANDWNAGDAVFNTGQVGDGFMDLYSIQGMAASTTQGPTIVGNIRNSTTYNDWSEHWAIGNLNGLYGYSSSAMGAAFGKYSNGQSFVTMDAASGVRMLYRTGGANTVFSRWDVSGSLIIGEQAASKSNVLISSGEISLRSNITRKISLQADGDVFIGTDTSAAASTLLTFFSNPQTYNGESMAAGDLLLGVNSSGSANMLWSSASKRLIFRGGTASAAYIDTDGKIVGGSGAAYLDANGMNVQLTTASATHRYYRLINASSFFMGGLGGQFSSACEVGVNLFALSSSAGQSYMTITASAGNGQAAYVYITAGCNANEYVQIELRKTSPGKGDTFIYKSDLEVPNGNVVVGNPLLSFSGSGHLAAASGIWLGDSANANTTIGLTLNQAGNDDEIVTLKSSDVAHGITDLTETDTYGFFKKWSPTAGGLLATGIAETTVGLDLRGVSKTTTAIRSTAASAAIMLRAYDDDGGTGITTPADNQNILAITAGSLTRFIFDSDGDLHADAAISASAFDAYDDVKLLTGLRASIMPTDAALRQRFSAWIDYAKPVLQQAGVVHYNADGHNFISLTKMHMLEIDALRQLYERLEQHESILQRLEAKHG